MSHQKPLNVRVAEALGIVCVDRSYECRAQCVGNVLDGGEIAKQRAGCTDLAARKFTVAN